MSKKVRDDHLSPASSPISVATRADQPPATDSIISSESPDAEEHSVVRSVGLPELISEIDHMHADIDFYECLRVIEDCLRLTSPVQYVIPTKAVAMEAAAVNDHEGDDKNKDEEEEKDVPSERVPPPPTGADSVTPLPPRRGPTPADPAYLVAADDMALNMEILDTAKITDSLAVHGASSYERMWHLRIIRCAEIVKKMR